MITFALLLQHKTEIVSPFQSGSPQTLLTLKITLKQLAEMNNLQFHSGHTKMKAINIPKIFICADFFIPFYSLPLQCVVLFSTRSPPSMAYSTYCTFCAPTRCTSFIFKRLCNGWDNLVVLYDFCCLCFLFCFFFGPPSTVHPSLYI